MLLRKIYRATIKRIISTEAHNRLVKCSDILRLKLLLMKIRAIYKKHPEKHDEMKYIAKHGFRFIPYDWSTLPLHEKYIVEVDDNNGLPYILADDRRMYFHKEISNPRGVLSILSREQNVKSPHRYVTSENHMVAADHTDEPPGIPRFFVQKGDVVADIGAAEGIFALSVIDIVSHIYLFECDEKWIPALEATFKPWRDKVTIVQKYVSDTDSETTITLDSFFKNKQINFIKADIEGFEEPMLEGAKELFAERNNLKAAICTYHKPTDPERFRQYFLSLGYQISFSPGYLAFPYIYSPDDSNSYLRRGVIRAWKSSQDSHVL